MNLYERGTNSALWRDRYSATSIPGEMPRPFLFLEYYGYLCDAPGMRTDSKIMRM